MVTRRKAWTQSESENALDGCLVVLTGKGLHQSGKAAHKGHLREFVMQMLDEWQPRIRYEVDARNTGQIKICESELVKEGVREFAVQRLTQPSEDWFINDFEERKQARKSNVVRYCYAYNEQRRLSRRNHIRVEGLS